MYSETFISLSKEAAFAYEIVSSGVTQIRKANYAKKGIYYQAFSNLSIGIERIAKLCILLDYYIENNGKFPNGKFLKDIGHNIIELYKRSINIKSKYKFNFEYLDNLDDEIRQKILSILSDFAIKDRYENLNNLVSSNQNNNPISNWFNDIDMKLSTRHISEKKKNNIRNNAEIADKLFGQFMLVDHISEDGNKIDKIDDASFRTGIFEAVSPFRQLYVAQIIRFFSELLRELQFEVMKVGGEDIPYFSEGFGCFYNNDGYLKTRKNYEI